MAAGMNTGAMLAAGIKAPDRATQDALVHALSAEAAGSRDWFVRRTQDPATKAPLLTAGIVAEVPSARPGRVGMYRLLLTCRPATHEASMQLSWSPASAPAGRIMSISIDGAPPFTRTIEAGEKMFQGAVGTMGTGAVILPPPFPSQTLTIDNLFPGETVVFPLASLDESLLQTFSTCSGGSGASQ